MTRISEKCKETAKEKTQERVPEQFYFLLWGEAHLTLSFQMYYLEAEYGSFMELSHTLVTNNL